MNPVRFVSRGCAHQCCRPRISVIQQQTPRFVSISIPRSYAQTIDVPASETAPSEWIEVPSGSSLEPESVENEMDSQQLYTGTISRTGTMRQTVQITRQNQVFDSFLQKHYTRPLRIKAHDPHPPTFLREGDVVEYGAYTQAEKEMKQAKDQTRNEAMIKKLAEQDKSGKMMRKFERDLAKKKEMQGNKARGVQYVVRRVVTPFGVGLEERMEKLGLNTDEPKQPPSSEGGQDSLLKGVGGNMGRKSNSAAVAG